MKKSLQSPASAAALGSPPRRPYMPAPTTGESPYAHEPGGSRRVPRRRSPRSVRIEDQTRPGETVAAVESRVPIRESEDRRANKRMTA